MRSRKVVKGIVTMLGMVALSANATAPSIPKTIHAPTTEFATELATETKREVIGLNETNVVVEKISAPMPKDPEPLEIPVEEETEAAAEIPVAKAANVVEDKALEVVDTVVAEEVADEDDDVWFEDVEEHDEVEEVEEVEEFEESTESGWVSDESLALSGQGMLGEPPLPPEEPEGFLNEPPLPLEFLPEEPRVGMIYPSSPGPWGREDYDPEQEYVAVPPNSDDQIDLMYPRFLTPGEFEAEFGIPADVLPEDYLERKKFLYADSDQLAPLDGQVD